MHVLKLKQKEIKIKIINVNAKIAVKHRIKDLIKFPVSVALKCQILQRTLDEIFPVRLRVQPELALPMQWLFAIAIVKTRKKRCYLYDFLQSSDKEHSYLSYITLTNGFIVFFIISCSSRSNIA